MSEFSTNELAFIGLSNEYCKALESTEGELRGSFVDNMLRLLPRLYICASDLKYSDEEGDVYVRAVLSEVEYYHIKDCITVLLADKDDYLEIYKDNTQFQEPVLASISEDLADIYQYLVNMLGNIKDAPESMAREVIAQTIAEFRAVWSQTLCNALRVLNDLRINNGLEDDSEGNYF